MPKYYLIYFAEGNVNERHGFLVDTIGAYPEEIQAHWMINFLGYYMAPIFIGASLIQLGAFSLYNWVLHPFKFLVQTVEKEKKSKSTFYIELEATERS